MHPSNTNQWSHAEKCVHIRRTRSKIISPVMEMCAPGAGHTLNFKQCVCIHTNVQIKAPLG